MSSIEDFLREFHKQNPGCTPAAFGQRFTRDRKTSYDIVASVLPKDHQIKVLDLACGDGTLLEQLSKGGVPLENLTGLDMSPGELDIAHKKFAGSSIRLFEGRAQEIPLPSHSLDFVLCHMAFMLMDDIEQVVSEIHRVLKPGGIFSAVVVGQFEETPVLEAYVSLLNEALREENALSLKNLGDQRTRNAEGILSLFAGGRFIQPGFVRDFVIELNEPAESVLEFFMQTYNVGLLSPKRRKLFAQSLLTKFKGLAGEDGKVGHSMGLRHFAFVRSGAGHA